LAGQRRGCPVRGDRQALAGPQPSGFTVYRHRQNGELISFAMQVVLDRPRAEEIAVDPLVAAAWEHSSTMPPRDGEYIAIARRVARPDAHLMPTAPVADAERLTTSRPWSGDRRLAWSYLAVEDAEFWQPLMGYLDQIRVPQTPVIDGRAFSVFAHDWRANAPRVVSTPEHRAGALRRYPR